MRGSTVERGEKFHAVLDLPRGEEAEVAGRLRDRREAEAARAHALNDVYSGRYVEPTTTTVRQFLAEEWLPASVRAAGSSSTPTPSPHRRRPLVSVTPVLLTKLYGRLLTSGG